MSDLAAFIAVVLAGVIAALIGLAVVRRAVPRTRLVRHSDIAAYVYAVIGVIYTVILAQIVIAAWEAKELVRSEIDAGLRAIGGES
jgi:hypothetical protein